MIHAVPAGTAAPVSHDGALIAITYSGVADLGNDGHQRFLEGNPPARISLHIVPRCQTVHPGYIWLNRIECLGIGEVDLEPSHVSYDICTVRLNGIFHYLT